MKSIKKLGSWPMIKLLSIFRHIFLVCTHSIILFLTEGKGLNLKYSWAIILSLKSSGWCTGGIVEASRIRSVAKRIYILLSTPCTSVLDSIILIIRFICAIIGWDRKLGLLFYLIHQWKHMRYGFFHILDDGYFYLKIISFFHASII